MQYAVHPEMGQIILCTYMRLSSYIIHFEKQRMRVCADVTCKKLPASNVPMPDTSTSPCASLGDTNLFATGGLLGGLSDCSELVLN